MNTKELNVLIRYFESSSLMTLSINDGEFHLFLSKLTVPEQNSTSVIATPANNNPLPLPAASQEISLLKEIISPLVGTFYSSNSPTGEPFLKVGQSVTKGQTVCIINAMKIMNEIASPFSGVVESILAKNGDAIGFNQPIIIVRLTE